MNQDPRTKYSWYQTIQFPDGYKSKGSTFCGDPAWPHIRSFLPDDLNGISILDLGCNAGIYAIRAALEGATTVGVENDSWKKEHYPDQARLTKQYFEKAYGSFPYQFIEADMEKFVWDDEAIKKAIGDTGFDYCLGIASLYYAKDIDRLAEGLFYTCDNIIVRARDEKIPKTCRALEKAGFKKIREFREKMWEIVKPPTDDFWLFHYASDTIL